jgi:hypothetical protein
MNALEVAKRAIILLAVTEKDEDPSDADASRELREIVSEALSRHQKNTADSVLDDACAERLRRFIASHPSVLNRSVSLTIEETLSFVGACIEQLSTIRGERSFTDEERHLGSELIALLNNLRGIVE